MSETTDFTKPGTVIEYGRYDRGDGTEEPIRWIVLDYQPWTNQLLVISQGCPDARVFHPSDSYPSWEKSQIRAWLNGKFLNLAFTEEEQECIVPTEISTQWYSGNDGGANTEDKLWLLSRDEASAFFPEDNDRRAMATGCARAKTDLVDDWGYCTWWLRSPGADRHEVSFVDCNGEIWTGETEDSGGIRPAMWLSLSMADISLPSEDSHRRADTAGKTFPEPGSRFTFGSYEQGDGVAPIEWIVLAHYADRNQAVVISRYALDAKAFHDGKTYPTWEKSSIRAWLNQDFLQTAFTPAEQKRILTAKIRTLSPDGNPCGNDTADKIWLLSREEALTFFKYDNARKAKATAYAASNGADEADEEYGGCCWWLLRSPAEEEDSVACVCDDGSPFEPYVNDDGNAVRPAMLIDLTGLDGLQSADTDSSAFDP